MDGLPSFRAPQTLPLTARIVSLRAAADVSIAIAQYCHLCIQSTEKP
jgi:hypothetical protein